MALLTLVGAPVGAALPEEAAVTAASETIAALEAEPERKRAEAAKLLRQATAAFEAGEVERSIELYGSVRELNPENPGGWLGGGIAAEAAGDLLSAIGLVAEAVRLDPERAELHLTHGRLLARSGAREPALRAFQRARSLDPANADGYLFAALLLRDGGSFAEAEALLREGIDKATPKPEFWDQLGLVLLSQQKSDAALRVVEDSLERYPATPRLELVRGLALAEIPERSGEAIASLERAIAGGEGGARARVQLAELLLGTDQPEQIEQAVARLEEAVVLAPDESQAHYLLGQALRQAGRHQEAGQALRRFQELRRERDSEGARATRLGTRFNKAVEHVREGRLEEALAAVEEILAEAPDHARTLALKAKILFSAGDVAGASNAAVAAREADPSLAENHYLEGLFLYHLKRFDEAGRALDRALAIDPELGEAHEVAAVIALSQGRGTDAVAHFERAIALGVDHDDLRRAYQLALEAAAAPSP